MEYCHNRHQKGSGNRKEGRARNKCVAKRATRVAKRAFLEESPLITRTGYRLVLLGENLV